MFKKYWLIFFLILGLAASGTASVWDGIGACLTDPCNCGLDDRNETWNGVVNSFRTNALCPPWNKDAGRNDNTCIVQFSYPGPFTPFYLNNCAQETNQSTYFNPQIGVMAQLCNSAACWVENDTLSWNGQCVVWPTGWGLPTLRICARLAAPANSVTGAPADPGYTPGVHLNSAGVTVPDPVIIGVDGHPVPFNMPKICAYRDPSLVSPISIETGPIIDPLDYNPLSQPMHKNSGVHPIAQIIIFLVQSNAVSQSQNLIDMLGAVFSNVGSSIAPEIGSAVGSNMSMFQVMLNAISGIIEFAPNTFVSILQKYGQFNDAVDNYHFGCVQIPLGPYPPPFCPVLAPFVPTATAQTICPKAPAGKIPKSTTNNPCVVSSLVNNSISNSIRVSFDNFVPLCQRGVDPTNPLTDKCVLINNLGALSSAKTMHAITAGNDNIKSCSSAPGSPCFSNNIPFSCSVSAHGCQNGYRIVYATKVGSQTIPSSYFNDDLQDCGVSASSNCQVIWGINTGEFIDVPLVFPKIETSDNLSPLVSRNFTLRDGNQTAHTFNATIVRQSTYLSDYGLKQDPSNICAFQIGNYLAGCTLRQPVPKPRVYACDSPFANSSGLSCTNSYFAPQFIASITDGNNSTSAIFRPLAVNNTNVTTYQMNLAGANFSSFVTDDSYIMKPFSGSHSANPSSIYGNYVGNAAPYDSKGKPTNAVYLSGLEYINGKYIQGGTFACLQSLDMTHCPSDTTVCVLSNLLNRNIVNCSSFTLKLSQYPNLNLCRGTETGCSKVDSLPGVPSGSGITINKCNSGYCYNDSQHLAVCQLSFNPNDRYLPSSNLGNILSASQYYNVNDRTGPGLNYNQSQYVLRDKTPAENGWCVGIPQPGCAAITTPGPNDGNATWPATDVGATANGTCVSGSVIANPGQPLQRNCLADLASGTITFAPLGPGALCKMSSIYLIENRNNIPSFVPQRQDNNNGLNGHVSVSQDYWIDSQILSPGYYYSNLTFNITNIANLQYFKIDQLAYDDYVLITVNGHKVFSGPWSFNSLSYNGSSAVVNGKEEGAQDGYRNNSFNMNLKPYLTEGLNYINISVVVSDIGTMAYLIGYGMNP